MKMTRGDCGPKPWNKHDTCWGATGGAFEVAAKSNLFTHSEVESTYVSF